MIEEKPSCQFCSFKTGHYVCPDAPVVKRVKEQEEEIKQLKEQLEAAKKEQIKDAEEGRR